MLINLALDRKATQREMTSVLISDLYGKFMSQKDISVGFDEMLNNLADLTIDAPEAPQVSTVIWVIEYIQVSPQVFSV